MSTIEIFEKLGTRFRRELTQDEYVQLGRSTAIHRVERDMNTEQYNVLLDLEKRTTPVPFTYGDKHFILRVSNVDLLPSRPPLVNVSYVLASVGEG